MELGFSTVRVEDNPKVQEYWLEENVDYELYTDPINIDVNVGNIVYNTYRTH